MTLYFLFYKAMASNCKKLITTNFKASLNGHFMGVSCVFNIGTHQHRRNICMKQEGETMQSFHPGETQARCFQSIGNRVKRSETSAVAFHFIPDPVRAGSAPSSSSSRRVPLSITLVSAGCHYQLLWFLQGAIINYFGFCRVPLWK